MRVAFIVKPFQVELLGIAYLSAVLRKKGHRTKLIKWDDYVIYNVNHFRPHVLAFSATTGQHAGYLNLNSYIKKEGVKTVFGGAHPTYFPDMIKEPGVDAIVRGEGELALEHYVWRVSTGRVWEKETIGPAPLIHDLDMIPFPDRDLLYTYEENKFNPIKNVITSRGCPFTCPYCYNGIYRDLYTQDKYWKNRWTRFRSPKAVIDECKDLVTKWPTKMIYFNDDEFTSNPKLFELLERYAKEVPVPFHCQLRIELLTEQKAKALKEAGCYSVTFAIESGNERIRKNLLLRKVDEDIIIKGAELLRKYKIKYRTENMVGIPTENVEEMLDTVRLNQRVRPTIGWCSIFQPYPNLPLSNYAKEANSWDGQMVSSENFFEETILNTPYKREIENIQKLFGFLVLFRIPLFWARILAGLNFSRLYKEIYRLIKSEGYKRLYGR